MRRRQTKPLKDMNDEELLLYAVHCLYELHDYKLPPLQHQICKELGKRVHQQVDLVESLPQDLFNNE